MRRVRRYLHHRHRAPAVIIAGFFVGVLTVTGFSMTGEEPIADMRLSPQHTAVEPGDTFAIQVVVEAEKPANVFAGDILFSPDVLEVVSIDYNTSIADIWVTRPWYENGAGTINFGGGTSAKGGFTGIGTLITVTFITKTEGDGAIALRQPRILLHDGLGTDAAIKLPIDAIVTVSEEMDSAQTGGSSTFVVTRTPPSTDLNGDGRQTLADMSIFMMNMFGGDARYDFNLDGHVDSTDFGILIQAR